MTKLDESIDKLMEEISVLRYEEYIFERDLNDTQPEVFLINFSM